MEFWLLKAPWLNRELQVQISRENVQVAGHHRVAKSAQTKS